MKPRNRNPKEIAPGDRCIITFSHCGDEGKIVVVERFFNPARELWADRVWTPNCRLLVTSLGSPLQGVLEGCSAPVYTSMTRPYPPEWLRKLPEVEDDQTVREVVTQPN